MEDIDEVDNIYPWYYMEEIDNIIIFTYYIDNRTI